MGFETKQQVRIPDYLFFGSHKIKMHRDKSVIIWCWSAFGKLQNQSWPLTGWLWIRWLKLYSGVCCFYSFFFLAFFYIKVNTIISYKAKKISVTLYQYGNDTIHLLTFCPLTVYAHWHSFLQCELLCKSCIRAEISKASDLF